MSISVLFAVTLFVQAFETDTALAGLANTRTLKAAATKVPARLALLLGFHIFPSPIKRHIH